MPQKTHARRALELKKRKEIFDARKKYTFVSDTKPSGVGPDDELREISAMSLSTLNVSRPKYEWRRRTAHQRVQEMRFGAYVASKPLTPESMARCLMSKDLDTRKRLLRYFSNAERSEYRKLRAIELREQSQTPRTYSQNRRFRQAIADL